MKKLKKLKKKIRKIVEENFCLSEGVIDMGISFKFSEKQVQEILDSPTPQGTFEDIFFEMFFFEEDESFDYMVGTIKKKLNREELILWLQNEDKLVEYLRETYDFENSNESHLDQRYKINIKIDCGNGNYDFSCDDVFTSGKIHKDSSILWLARQQKKVMALRTAFKEAYVDRPLTEDAFVKSCVEEWENLPYSTGTLTFLVSMSLAQILDLAKKYREEEPLNRDCALEKRKGTGYFTLGKETTCGLFDRWTGSGSLLGIELAKDVKIPLKVLWDMNVDGQRKYDVGEVYDLCNSSWKETYK